MMSWFQTPVTVTASATGRPLNPQPRSIANETAMPGAAPPGRDVRRRRRGLCDDERLTKAEARQRRLPRRRVREDIHDRRHGQREQRLPGERLDHVPDVAVVGDARQDEEERRHDHARLRRRRRSAAGAVSGRETPSSGSPPAACRSPSSRTLPAYDLAHGAGGADGDARARGDVRHRPRVVTTRSTSSRWRSATTASSATARQRRSSATARPSSPRSAWLEEAAPQLGDDPWAFDEIHDRLPAASKRRARLSTQLCTTSARSRRACRSIGFSA